MPMTKCGGCGKFISPADAARCTKCNLHYHRVCVGLATRGAVPTFWQCPECRKNLRRDNKSETPVRNSQMDIQTGMPPLISSESSGLGSAPSRESAEEDLDESLTTEQVHQDQQNNVVGIDAAVVASQLDVASQLRIIMEELRNLRLEVIELRKEVKSSNDTCNGRMDTIEARLQVLEERHADGPADVAVVEGVVEQLKRELNDRDQELMANDLVIANLPETPAENPVHMVKAIATKLGVSLDIRDIVYAERVGGRHLKPTSPTKPAEVRPRAVMVRLARRDLRDDILDSARVRRGATTEDLGIAGSARRFYINERLTKTNQELFRKTRAAAGVHGWRFVWTRRGRILTTSCRLRVTTYALQITNYVRATSYGLRTTSIGLRTKSNELRTTRYRFRVTGYGLRTTDYELPTTDYRLQTTDHDNSVCNTM
ncbi:unnamed protein product [Spodoptera littoralis]|uniref:Zinc finger PHD-type domain-containing protein n=1 Tax=Spodoptera littoralis TaxID=7109 RepID=A0A9P0I636_SPOLI|nr:unnamed protein product [Spodoptera littoralis]CAH1640908.1 unnamed protein product [Spodoptera littoralis]